MYVAVLVTHKRQLAGGKCHRFRADTKKTANINDHLGGGSHPVNMRHRPDLLIVGVVNDGVGQVFLIEFAVDKQCV